MKRKATGILLAVLLIFSCVPVSAAETGDLEYEVMNDTEIKITDCNDAIAGSFTIPDTIDGKPVTSIGAYAFHKCQSLTGVVISDSVTEIGDYAFDGCTSLISVEIPDSVTEIGDHAFDGCTSLTSVTIPDSVTEIGLGAFVDCSSLTGVTIPDSVTEIGYSAFFGTAIYEDENNWANGVLYLGRHLIDAKDDISGEYTIKDGTKRIGERAFYSCDPLTGVLIPDSVTSIGKHAFDDCTSLTEINVDENNPAYCSVDGVLFNRNKTELVCYPAYKRYTEYVIPDGVTSIGESAFYDCISLTGIMIPDSVTEIGENVFEYCEALTDVYYTGSEEEWSKIKIGDSNVSFGGKIMLHYDYGETGGAVGGEGKAEAADSTPSAASSNAPVSSPESADNAGIVTAVIAAAVVLVAAAAILIAVLAKKKKSKA